MHSILKLRMTRGTLGTALSPVLVLSTSGSPKSERLSVINL